MKVYWKSMISHILHFLHPSILCWQCVDICAGTVYLHTVHIRARMHSDVSAAHMSASTLAPVLRGRNNQCCFTLCWCRGGTSVLTLTILSCREKRHRHAQHQPSTFIVTSCLLRQSDTTQLRPWKCRRRTQNIYWNNLPQLPSIATELSGGGQQLRRRRNGCLSSFAQHLNISLALTFGEKQKGRKSQDHT